ncbi:MAG: hypothetical protein V4720_14570 [Pseudomonadota bacterium]|uniref:hypothetical protein n=1 Tax=Tabrizicola sp. TaxID=2005166 RepID=UPI0025F782DD|nr:hypothetical protein [Tabrizicola sp.]
MPHPQAAELTEEERSKDAFFQRIALVGEEMIAAHGREFATGAFVLAARWISEGRMGAKAAAGGQTRHN